MCTQSVASFLLVLSTRLLGASSFTTSSSRHGGLSHDGHLIPKSPLPHAHTSSSSTTSTHASSSTTTTSINWTPQDLTKDNDGFLPIPPNDYIKQYQSNPLQLWPVEFFVIVYRHVNNSPHPPDTTTTKATAKTTTQILARKSANGTSKYGVGTGVPVTRWMLSSSSQSPPRGYQKVMPEITFDASNFPEFVTDDDEDGSGSRASWTYSKIDICEDAFHSNSMANNDDDDDDDANNFEDDHLQEYASNIRQQLQNELSQQLQTKKEEGETSDWDFNVLSTVKSILDNDNSVAAIQGSFRMSGLFGSKDNTTNDDDDRSATNNNSHQCHVNINKAPSPSTIAKSTKIYTMFPQMPNPLPPPTSTPHELREEILTRSKRMQESGRDPHIDQYGRVYTHISTSNVSNTIHGVYMTVDASEILPSGLNGEEEDVPPAYDLFGTVPIEREWVSLDDLKVTELVDGGQKSMIGQCDTKNDFISGFIVRQLIRDGVIGVDLE